MKPTTTFSNLLPAVPKNLLLNFAMALVFLLSAVGGAAAVMPESPRELVERTSVELRINGTPSDGIICFELKLSSVTAKGTNGRMTALVSEPLTVEIMHLAGNSEPVVLSSLPQGQYTDVAIAANGARVTSLDPISGLLVSKQIATNYNTTIHFQPALTVDANPVVLSLQVNPASVVNSVGMANNGIRTSAQIFRVDATRLTASVRGKLAKRAADRIVGSVTQISSRSLTLINGQTGAALTFRIGRNTRFDNAALSTLHGLIVAVRSRSDKDGLLVATEVEALENGNGTVMDGVASGYIPDSNLVTLASQDGYGSGMKSSIVGSGISVDPSQNPNFVVDAQDMDMTGLDWLRFDADSLVLGQHLQVQSMRAIQRDAKGNAARVVPETVRLEPQTLTGTVANYKPGTTLGTFTFDLVFATNASANVLNPFFYTMHVYQQRGTDMQSVPAGISNGAKVQVWGLVFYSQLPQGSSNVKATRGNAVRFLVRQQNEPAFIMVAGRIGAN
jgi:Domain of unknown function (DUF5666)